MVPLPQDASYSKELLFRLRNPVVLTVDRFDEVWPLVCNVYTFRNKSIQQNGEPAASAIKLSVRLQSN